MRFNKPIERWFPAPGDPDKSEHLIRHLLPGEILDSILSATDQETKYIIDKKSGDMTPEAVSRTKPGEIALAQFMSALRGWKNMFDSDGAVMEFNDANKLRAYREIDGYAEFITDLREKLAKDILEEEEARRKN